MCGIIGYVGKDKKSLHVLINGLKNLEYRGYDSAGIALKDNKKIKIIKAKGKIKNLEEKVKNGIETNIGIGHTRWATHGKATEINAHPHRVGSVTIVHNGIIENYIEIKNKLLKEGYSFNSETDSEVACALIDKIYKEEQDKLKTLKKVNKELKGSYAFAIIFEDDNKLYAMRKDSPLIIGVGKNENYLASDVPAILEFTNKYILLDKNEYAIVSETSINIYDSKLQKIEKSINTYEATREQAMKNDYEHFMLKEINDEPLAFEELLKQFNLNNIDELTNSMPSLEKYENIDIVGCGSAYHAGLIGKSIIEKYADIPVNVEIASEYRYKKNFNNEKTLTILISQSGETADTLAALRKVKEKGYDTLGIINTVDSSIARESDNVLYIKAGCEISVATTKAYSAQVLILTLIALVIANNKKTLNKNEIKNILKDIKILQSNIKTEINKQEQCKEIANKLYKAKDIFFIGRGIDYALCMEGSLKLKEISYIHSESYAAGELKHGTISLIEEQTPVIAIVTDSSISEKTMSNIKEVKARGAKVVLITTNKILNKYKESHIYDAFITIEDISPVIHPLHVATLLQLIAYYVAKEKGLDIDKPRNLAKSVTVE